MRLIDKLKKKLKRMEWWNKYRSNFYLSTMLPLSGVYLLVSPFFPIVGILSLVIYLIIGIIGGIDIVINEGKLERKIDDLKGHIDALQGVNKDTLFVVEQELERAKAESPTTEHGKEEKKSLIRELIERKNLIKKAIEEKEIADETALVL